MVALLAPAGCDGSVPGPEPGWERGWEGDEDDGALLSSWGTSAERMFAVGGQVERQGDAGQGLLLHRVEGAWASASLPSATPLLNWVHGSGDVVWTVGNAGASLRRDADGEWEPIDTGVEVPLWGVFALDEDDVWAVGGDAFVRGGAVMLHFDGQSWSEQTLPALDREPTALFKVWAADARHVFAVGDSGVILGFDGRDWEQMPSGTASDLISLWGTGPDEIVAVGGRALGTVMRFDGERWTGIEIGTLPGLNGVWMDADGVATVVGNQGRVASLAAGELEPEDVDAPEAGQDVLHAVFGMPGAFRVAVGGTLDRSPPYSGILLEGPW